ncbi:cache domain-containing protein [Paenibacillus hexagrammi]|uniref:Cache domain-containing protein n=1 Tax=Paenibacillus hexagrammi TaxID=2908839 RepID=A0ABY3SLC0_9BACL|nr:cache domain-containing protein [Paenibacillus sp. YPD9-1]UJF34668.1 cache domain-containing protein [Paenibacillus sp. YPD9-1]
MKRESGNSAEQLSSIRSTPFYDRNVIKVIALACVLIVFSMLLIGFLSYYFTEREVIKKLKNKELGYIAQSVASKVEGRIERAKETSLLLADDPSVVEWVRSGEQNEELSRIVLEKLKMNGQKLDYSNSFIVSSVSGQYWSENGTVLEIMSKDNPDDDWFYQTLISGKKADVIVDYNDARKQSFVFVNVLIGDASSPIGVAGVGLSLKDLSDDFESYKYSADSRMWMVDASGTIHLSDRFELTGSRLSDIVSRETYDKVMDGFHRDVQVLESYNLNGELVDMISYPIQTMNMRLLFQIPRSDTVYFLNSIKINTAIAILIALFSTVFFFSMFLAN